jgi:hypothetical protein
MRRARFESHRLRAPRLTPCIHLGELTILDLENAPAASSDRKRGRQRLPRRRGGQQPCAQYRPLREQLRGRHAQARGLALKQLRGHRARHLAHHLRTRSASAGFFLKENYLLSLILYEIYEK